MSRNRKRKRAIKGHLVDGRRDISKEQEILHSDIHKDPTIEAILASMPEASESQALELALRLQKIARPEANLLDSPELSDTLNAMRADAAERDKVWQAYQSNKEAFIEGVFNDAEGRKLTGQAAEEAKKRVANALAVARQGAKINRADRRRKLEQTLRLAPKEEIYVTGEVEIVRKGKGLVPTIMPEIIRIGHVQFVLAPGKHTVPQQVAEIHRQRLLSKQETQEREDMVSVDRIDIDRNIADKWNTNKYTKAEPFPVGTGIAGG